MFANELDSTLAALTKVIAGEGGEFGVSLLVGGSWLTGLAISPRAWFNQLAHAVDGAERGGEIGEVFTTLGQSMYPTDDEVEAGLAEEPADDLPDYIHLREARLVAGSGYENTGSLVRVRLTHVSAWMLANIGPHYDPPPPPPI